MMEEKQNQLAKEIQGNFPIESEPYKILAERINVSEKEVIEQHHKWKESKLLREISAIMEGSVLGYDAALVCGYVPKNLFKKTAEFISNHPTVSHCYERSHHYNLWFTIALPKNMSIEKTLEIFERHCQIEKLYPLRRQYTFKIGVSFDLQSKKNITEKKEAMNSFYREKFNYKKRTMIRALQMDLPVAKRPFKQLAETNNLDEMELLTFLKTNLGKAIRRYVATFRHRKLGVHANGMVVWNVSKESLDQKGHELANYLEVSHCYARTAFPDFPYNLYSMLHAGNKDELNSMIDSVSEKLYIKDYLVMNSTQEFKKCRLRYFLPELDEWWEKYIKQVA